MPVDAFMANIVEGSIPRVTGTAVFRTRTQGDAPPVMVWHIKHNRALHERLFVLTVTTESVPRVRDTERLSLEEIAPRFWRAAAHYGFMERPDIPALLHAAHGRGCGIDLSDVTYYVGHETVVHADDERALPRWVEAVFAVMQRNSAHLPIISGCRLRRSSKSAGEEREFLVAEPSVCRRVRGWDLEFASGLLQRGVTCELDFLDQGAELGYRVPDHGATRPVTVPRSGPSRVTAVANLLMTPIGLTLRPPRLLTSQSHFNRRYHGAYNDQLARNATSR